MVRPAVRWPSGTPLFAGGFAVLGITDGMLGVLWPSIGSAFGQPVAALGLVLAVIVIGAATSSPIAGRALRRWSVGWILAFGAVVWAAAVATFALASTWPVFVVGAYVYGFGSGALDSGVNAFTASRASLRYLNALHSVYGAGIMTGPLAATLAVEHDAWRASYLAVLPVLAIVAAGSAWFGPRLRPAPGSASRAPDRSEAPPAAGWIVLTVLVLFFLYAAVEVTTGQWAFTLLTETRGLPTVLSGIGVSLFWGSFTVGRVATGTLGHRLSARALLALSGGGSLAGVSLVAWSPSALLGFAGLPIAGFFLGPFFPGLVSAVPLRVGADRSGSVVGWGLASANIGILAGSAIAGAVAARWGLGLVGPWLFVLAVLLALAVVVEFARVGSSSGGSRVERSELRLL